MKERFLGIKSYLIYGSGQLINLVTPLLIAPYVISVCGIEKWGKIGVAMSVFLILSLAIDFGSLLLGVKEVSIKRNNIQKLSEYLNISFTIKFLFLLILLISILFIGLFDLDVKLYLFSAIILLAQFFNPLWIYQGLEEFKTINKIIFISKFMYVLLVYLLVKQPEDYYLVLFLLGFSNTLIYSIWYFKLSKKYEIRLFKTNYNELRLEFQNTLPILLSNVSISVYTNSPIIIVKYLLGDFYAGIYKIGDMILNLFRSYLSVFFNVSFPKFCNLYSENKEAGINYLKRMNSLNVLLIFIISISLLFLTYFYIDFYLPNKEIKQAILFCNKFLLIPIIVSLNIPFYQFLIYKNQQKALSTIMFVLTLFMLICGYYLTLKFKTNGTLATIYITETLITFSIIVYFYRNFYKSINFSNNDRTL